MLDLAPRWQNISTSTGSKDLQMVSITLRVLSRPDQEHLSKIYQTLGTDYDERVLPSIGNEVLKAIVAQFDAAELITQREVVRMGHGNSKIMLTVCIRYLLVFAKTSWLVRASFTSSWKMFQSPI